MCATQRCARLMPTDLFCGGISRGQRHTPVEARQRVLVPPLHMWSVDWSRGSSLSMSLASPTAVDEETRVLHLVRARLLHPCTRIF